MFGRTRVLQTTPRYPFNFYQAFELDPAKMKYDYQKYGMQYTNKQIREGYDQGQNWMARVSEATPKPEIKDMQNAQMTVWLFWGAGVFWMMTQVYKQKSQDDKEFWQRVILSKEHVGRYSYLTEPIEYSRRWSARPANGQ